MLIKIVKVIFLLYQGVTASKIATCRFDPTCSKYFVDAVEKYGFFKGARKGISRLLACHPLSKRSAFDPA